MCRDWKKDLAIWTTGVAGRSGEGQRPTMEIEAWLPHSSASLLEERLYHSDVCLVVIQCTFLSAAAQWDLILDVRTLWMLIAFLTVLEWGLLEGGRGRGKG